MKFMLRHWYDISLWIAIAIFVSLIVLWGDISVMQRFAIANLGVIFLHFFEEFGFPGGFGKLANTLLFDDSPAIERYPLNQLSVWVGNWGFAVMFYLPPIFFPNVIWLGLMPMLFGMVGQLFSHAVLNNMMLKKAGLRYGYNSGLATALLGHTPLAVGYIIYISGNSLATLWDWTIAVAYMIFAYLVVFRKGIITGMAKVNSPHPFDAIELGRFNRLYCAPGTHVTSE
ncbi:MAG: HXXEE domain-containing protein [Ancrocorticia sp.]